MKPHRTLPLALLTGLLLSACGGGGTPDGTKPTVSLDATLVDRTVTLKATATDDVGVTKVTFYRGTTLISEDSSVPYEATTSLGVGESGTVTFRAVATDMAGNTAEASDSIDTSAPTLTATGPASTALKTVTISGTASDPDGITKLTYALNGGAAVDVTAQLVNGKYSFTVDLAGGANTVVVRATDSTGASSSATVTTNFLAGAGSVQGTVVDQNIGAPVAGSTVTVLQNGTELGSVTTGADGTFTVPSLAAGTYDLKARKAGMAGSDVYGLVVGTNATSVKLVQRPAFETSATTDPAKLILTRADGTTPLAGATFTNGVDFRIRSAEDSNHVGPVRIVYAQLGRTPGSAVVTASATANNWNFSPKQDEPSKVDSGAVTLPNDASPNFIAGFGSAAGETVYLEVLAVDYNYNYARYIVPIRLINTNGAAANTVEAPTLATATAFTLKQEGSWTTPYQAPGAQAGTPVGDAAPNGSGVFVEVRWCYTNTAGAAKPFAFDIERSEDGTTFTKVGTVGGGANADCSATNQAARPFNFRDTSAALTVGKTFTYRVIARGANTAASNTTKTTPLAQFTPQFVAPADETTGVSLTPTLVWGGNQIAIGADGAGYNLRLRDLYSLSGYNLPGASANALIRVEEGTGDAGNKVPAGQALVFLSSGAVLTKPASAGLVLTDTAGVYAAAKPNFAPVDTAAHTVSLPLNLLTGASLQPLRPYKWELYSGFAYKYAPTEGGRVSAYSVYTWPDSTVAPIFQTRPVNINWDFITAAQ